MTFLTALIEILTGPVALMVATPLLTFMAAFEIRRQE